MCEAHDILRLLKLSNGSSLETQMVITRTSNSGAYYIEALEIEHGRSREIQMVVTFHSDVRFEDITHLDARN